MNIFDKHFKFPTILVDGNIDDKKVMDGEKMGTDLDVYPEFIVGEASVNYEDFSHIVTYWQPTEDSYEDASLEEIFDASLVTFREAGTFLVPMNVEEFKEKFIEFIEQYKMKELEEQIDNLKIKTKI